MRRDRMDENILQLYALVAELLKGDDKVGKSAKAIASTIKILTKELEKELIQSKVRIEALEDALREIRDTQGKVCQDYMVCQHISCSSSYSSWAIADKALSDKKNL